jgi:tripartite-type tricarboxylate transporter receptor subunit TctC
LKIITLEKGNDGVYTSTGEVEEQQEIRQEIRQESKQEIRKVPERRQTRSRKHVRQNPMSITNEDVHRFIAKNGDKASEFMRGLETSVKAFNLIKKMMK